MSHSESVTVPSLAPMPCPAYLVAAHEGHGGWEIASYRVLFAQHDGDRAQLLVCHPAYGGLVTVDRVSDDHPALVLIDPTEEELDEARLLVRAKAVASQFRVGATERLDRDGRDSRPIRGTPSNGSGG